VTLPRSDLVPRLLAVLSGLNASVPIPELLTRVTDSTKDLLQAHSAGLAVREGDVMRIVAGAGDRTQIIGGAFPYKGSVAEQLVQSDRRSLDGPASVFPYLGEDRFGPTPQRMALALATVEDDAVGALYVIRDAPLTPDELEVLELLAVSAGVALHSAERYTAAIVARREKDAVIDAMADGLAVLDADGRVRTWNRALAEMTGIAPRDALGQPMPIPLPSGGQALDHELPNGRWIEIVVAPVYGTQDRVVDVRDVSRAKALEGAKDLFLATASHELRTPLTVLRGFGETLLHHWDVLDDERRREIIGTILTRTEAMTGLVEQLLLGSRAGIGMDVHIKPFDLAAAVRVAARSIAGSRPTHPLEVSATEVVMAYGDEGTVDPVLGQLVENAAKYTPQGGPISIEVCRDGGDAVLTVADRGVGIPAADLDRVFDRFVRSEGVDAGGVTGAGLGLWIVRRYLEAQGGRVAAQQRPGGGTVIEVRLPLA
jgi:signal transduction histidine kinase